MKKLLLILIGIQSLSTINAQTWSALGTGMSDTSNSYTPGVFALNVFQGNLIAGGYFDSAGGINAHCIAQWNGSSWDSSTGATVFGHYQYDKGNAVVYALSTFKGNLVAGGFWISYDFAEWNGTKWFDSSGGVGLYNPYCQTCVPTIVAYAIYGGNLIVGGSFNRAGTIWSLYNSNTNFGSIAQVNDTNWSSMNVGTGVNYGYVGALAVYNGYLIAGGGFDSIGGIKAKNIAAWNGTSWRSLGSGITGTVSSLLTDYSSGYLIAGGTFSIAGGVPVNNIAAWDGHTWHAMGNGINDGVSALVSYNNYIVAGGSFTMAGTSPANNIAEWSNNTWKPLGSGVNKPVYAFTVYNGNLIVGGGFDTAGGIRANCIAQWTQPLGVNEIKSNSGEITLYPNPNNGRFNLVIGSEAKQSHPTVEFYNMLGEKALTLSLSQAGEEIIDMGSQPAGIYLYRVISETGSLMGEGKFVIEW